MKSSIKTNGSYIEMDVNALNTNHHHVKLRELSLRLFVAEIKEKKSNEK